MARKSKPTFDWGRLSKLFFSVALLFLVWVLVPAGRCTIANMGGQQINEQETDDEFNADDDFALSEPRVRGVAGEYSSERSFGRDPGEESSDADRVQQTQGFFERFFGAVGFCYDQHPIQRAQAWQLYCLGTSAGLAILFLIIARAVRPRYERI